MTSLINPLPILKGIVGRVSVGIFAIDEEFSIVLWNEFMENHSQKKSADVLGKNLFECFPELPKQWLERKIKNVFLLKNFSFTSWEHRPYLFRFQHNRPITGGVDYMRQNCTFLPIKDENDQFKYVCVTIFDATDTSIYEGMLKNAVKSLAEASNRDGLTELYNRRYLEQAMRRELGRTTRYGGTLSCVIVDLDFFKKINDTYGHVTGDEVLRAAAQTFSINLRASDTLGRYGGEEFVLILPETDSEGAMILADRLRIRLEETPIQIVGGAIHVTASIGVATYHDGIKDPETFLHEADTALYHSKRTGRNRVTLFSSALALEKPPQVATSPTPEAVAVEVTAEPPAMDQTTSTESIAPEKPSVVVIPKLHAVPRHGSEAPEGPTQSEQPTATTEELPQQAPTQSATTREPMHIVIGYR